MPGQGGHKRVQYIVSAQFQLRYVRLILMLVFLTGLLCSYVVYYTSMFLLGDKLANVYPQGRLISIVNTVNFRILLSLVLVTPLVVLISIYASHKIAGPMYRMERHLKGMAAGDLSVPLTLRKTDELTSLANGINLVSDSVRATIEQEREHLARASVSLDNLKKTIQSASADKASLENTADKLGEDLNKLNLELNKYKV